MKNSTLFAIVIVVLCLMGCNNGTEQERTLGKYVYIDYEYILHTQNDCPYICTHKGGKPIYKVFMVSDLNEEYSICSQCLTESMYEELKYHIDANPIVNGNIKRIHEALCKNYSDIPYNYNEFKNSLSDTNTLKMIYSRLIHDESILFFSDPEDFFESFKIDLGLDPKHRRTPLKLLVVR